MPNPRERKGEKIGGGFFVFRRGKKTGRIGCKRDALPFEHPDWESAYKEAWRLAIKYKGETFVIIAECQDDDYPSVKAFVPKD